MTSDTAAALVLPSVILAGLFGLVIGSFLNVVIWRVPRGESVVSPPSACPGCGHAIRARDNVPLLSWLLLKGRCRDCSQPISARYPLVEFATGVLWAVTTWWLGPVWELPAFLYLASIAVALTLIDIDVKRLPDAIVLPSYLVTAVLLTAAAVAQPDSMRRLVSCALGGVAMLALYVTIRLVNPKGMGLGDVKLAGVLGLYLGWFGMAAVAVGVFAAFLIGAVVGVALIGATSAGRSKRGKLGIPFGPFMVTGAYVGLWAAAPIAAWYLQFVGI